MQCKQTHFISQVDVQANGKIIYILASSDTRKIGRSTSYYLLSGSDCCTLISNFKNLAKTISKLKWLLTAVLAV